MDEDGSSCKETSCVSDDSVWQYGTGSECALAAHVQVVRSVTSEDRTNDLWWNETTDVSQPQYTGGDDTGDEETERGDGGSGERVSGEQPVSGEIWHTDC